MRIQTLSNWLEVERSRIVLWTPVFLGIGIWRYLDGVAEPDVWQLIYCAILPMILLPLAHYLGWGWRGLLPFALSIGLLGYGAGAMRAHLLAAPVLKSSVNATVEGIVAQTYKSSGSGAKGVILDDPVIYGIASEDTPKRLRMTLLGGVFDRPVEIGDRIRVFARLGAPFAPVEPQGFDYRRHAWFEQIGAIGYARGPLILLPASQVDQRAYWLSRFRVETANKIMDLVPDDSGAFLAALVTGIRQQLPANQLGHLRHAGLAHLLAISGLHMGILTGLAYAAARMALAFAPFLRDRIAGRKIAAFLAIIVGLGYLAVSGSSVSTQRAFIMVLVAFGAVLLDRRAISMRSVAIAATLVLVVFPETLLSPGFQMSFAATAALVACYEMTEKWRSWSKMAAQKEGEAGRLFAGLSHKFMQPSSVWLKLAKWPLGLLLASAVAGLATAPFVADSFNYISRYSLLANLLALPIVSLWIAPLTVLAGLLAPLGLAGPLLSLAGLGVDLVLNIAQWVSGMPSAVDFVHTAPHFLMYLVVFAGCWLFLWQTSMRWLSIPVLLSVPLIWHFDESRPVLLVSESGQQIGFMGDEGRATAAGLSDRFAVSAWLQADGDQASSIQAAQRPGLMRFADRIEASLEDGSKVLMLTRQPSEERLSSYCREGYLLVIPWKLEIPQGPCMALNKDSLEALGSLGIERHEGAFLVEGSRVDARERLWSDSHDTSFGY